MAAKEHMAGRGLDNGPERIVAEISGGQQGKTE